MNQKKYITLATFLLLSASLMSQVNLNYNNHNMYNNITTTSMDPQLFEVIDGVSTVHYDLSHADFVGSPFLTADFIIGNMTILDGTVVPGLKYRYDIYGDRMQFIVNQDTATINKPLALRSVEIGEWKFVYEVYMIDANTVATGYFEVVEEGEFLTILFRREIELDQDVYVSNYGGGGGTKDFIIKENNSYYLKHKTSAAQKINSRKDFLKIISDHQEQVKKYMKDHRLSVKKKEDLVSITTYYSSLQDQDS